MQTEVVVYHPALDKRTGRVVYPVSPDIYSHLPQGFPIDHILPISKASDYSKRYECLSCGEEVRPKRGTKKRWHFAHLPCGSACAIENTKCVRKGESDAHMLSKYALHDFLSRKCKLYITGPPCSNKLCPGTKDTILVEIKDGDAIRTEYNIPNNGGRADVAVIRQDKVRYIFEVYKTSKTLERPGEWYEIHADEILSKMHEMRAGNEVSLQDTRPYHCGRCPVPDLAHKIKFAENICGRPSFEGLGPNSGVSDSGYMREPSRRHDLPCRGSCLEDIGCGYSTTDKSCCQPVLCKQCQVPYPLWLLEQYSDVCMSCDISNFYRSNRKRYLPRGRHFPPDVYKAFYIMETIDFTDGLLEITGDILYGISPDNEYVSGAWKSWARDRKSPTTKMTIGKHKGKRLCDIPINEFVWMDGYYTYGLSEKLRSEISEMNTFLNRLETCYSNHGNYTMGLLIYKYRLSLGDEKMSKYPPVIDRDTYYERCVIYISR